MQTKSERSREADEGADMSVKGGNLSSSHDLLDPVYIPYDFGEDWDDDDEQDEGWGCDL